MTFGSQVLVAGVRSGVLARIESELGTYSDAERRVADVILADPSKVLVLPIGAMAEACAVAQPTLSRFAKRIGLESYPAMRLAIAHDLATPASADRAADRYEGLDRLYRALAADASMQRIAHRLAGAPGVEIWASSEYAETAHGLAESLRAECVHAAASTNPTAWPKIARGLPDGTLVLLLTHDDGAAWRVGLPAAREHELPVVAIAPAVPRGIELDDVLVIPGVADPRRSGIAVADALLGAVTALSTSGDLPGPASPRRQWRHTTRHVLSVSGAELECIFLHHPDADPERPLAVFFNGMRSQKEHGVPPGAAVNRISPALTSSLLNAGLNVLLLDNPGHGQRRPAWQEPGDVLVRSARGEGPDVLSESRRDAESLVDAVVAAGLVTDPSNIAIVGQSWGALQALQALVGDPRVRHGVLVIPICDVTQIRELAPLADEPRVVESGFSTEHIESLASRSLLFIGGAEDEIASPEVMERFAERLRAHSAADVTTEVLPGVAHQFDPREGDLMAMWLTNHLRPAAMSS